MIRFRQGCRGRFTVHATLIRGANEDPDSIEWIRKALGLLYPTAVVLENFTEEKFGRVLGVPGKKLQGKNKRCSLE